MPDAEREAAHRCGVCPNTDPRVLRAAAVAWGGQSLDSELLPSLPGGLGGLPQWTLSACDFAEAR